MQAVRFVGVGRPPQIEDVKKPSPGPGQIAHQDRWRRRVPLRSARDGGRLRLQAPFTLGHENAGWVSERGDGVTGVKDGDPVAVYGPWGCGLCHACQQSMENYCENWAQLTASAVAWVSTAVWPNSCSCRPRGCSSRSAA